jgi:hypothetical protein
VPASAVERTTARDVVLSFKEEPFDGAPGTRPGQRGTNGDRR